MIRYGVGLLQNLAPHELAEVVELCEDLGYDTVWYANEKFYRDSWIGLTLAAAASSRLRLGTFITDPYTMHPALIAVAAATLDEVAQGRFVLLLGAGGTGLDRLGIERRRPVQALAEAVHVIRRLVAGERVSYEGRTTRLDDVRLSFEARSDIPIYIAARGDKALTMAGEFADGAMIATYATPQGLDHALTRIAEGAEKAGREIGDLAIVSRVDGWIDSDPQRARDALRPMIARLLSASYPDRSFVTAAGAEIPAELEEIAALRNREVAGESARLVPDSLVDSFAWAGTAVEVAARIDAVVALGIRDITFMPHPPPGESVVTGIRAFAKQVMPLVGEAA